MKKLLALALAVMMVASMAVVASAESTTTLTTTVPAASYTLNIPADQEIPFGATSTDIGCVTVTDSAGFASGKNLNVTITYGAFTCEGISTTIPFVVNMSGKYWGGRSAGAASNDNLASGGHLCFEGLSNSQVREHPRHSLTEYDSMNIVIATSDWGKALGGNYSATITFTAEVVVAQ